MRLKIFEDAGDIERFKFNKDRKGNFGPPGERGPSVGREYPLILKFGEWDEGVEHRLVEGINLKLLTVKQVKALAGPWENDEPTGKILDYAMDSISGKERHNRLLKALNTVYGDGVGKRILHGTDDIDRGSWRTWTKGLMTNKVVEPDDLLDIARKLKNVDNDKPFIEEYLADTPEEIDDVEERDTREKEELSDEDTVADIEDKDIDEVEKAIRHKEEVKDSLELPKPKKKRKKAPRKPPSTQVPEERPEAKEKQKRRQEDISPDLSIDDDEVDLDFKNNSNDEIADAVEDALGDQDVQGPEDEDEN